MRGFLHGVAHGLILRAVITGGLLVVGLPVFVLWTSADHVINDKPVVVTTGHYYSGRPFLAGESRTASVVRTIDECIVRVAGPLPAATTPAQRMANRSATLDAEAKCKVYQQAYPAADWQIGAQR